MKQAESELGENQFTHERTTLSGGFGFEAKSSHIQNYNYSSTALKLKLKKLVSSLEGCGSMLQVEQTTLQSNV